MNRLTNLNNKGIFKEAKKHKIPAVAELLHTEEKYVDVLEKVVCGYMNEFYNENSDIPPPDDLKEYSRFVIFSNIVEIYRFHKNYFSKALQENHHSARTLSNIFIQNQHNFHMYSKYSLNKQVSEHVISTNFNYFDKIRKKLGHKEYSKKIKNFGIPCLSCCTSVLSSGVEWSSGGGISKLLLAAGALGFGISKLLFTASMECKVLLAAAIRAIIAGVTEIADLMIAPVQRITRYPLMLDSICKHLIKHGLPEDVEHINEANNMLKGVVKKVNEFDVLNGIRNFDGIISEQGNLILHGSLTCEHNGKRSKFYVYLFKSSILFTEKQEHKRPCLSPTYNFRLRLPVNQLHLKELNCCKFSLQLTDPNSPSCNVICQTESKVENEKWTHAIRQLLVTQLDLIHDLVHPCANDEREILL